MIFKYDKWLLYLSFLEFYYDCCHVISPIGISIAGTWVQVFVKECLQNLTTIWCLQTLLKLFDQLWRIIIVFLPNTVTSHYNHFFLSCPFHFNYIRHASDGLLVECESWNSFMAKITNWASQVQSINSSLNDRNSCLLYSLFLDWIFRFMVDWKGNTFSFLTECCSWVSCVGTYNFILRYCYYHSCGTGIELPLSSCSFELLSFIAK